VRRAVAAGIVVLVCVSAVAASAESSANPHVGKVVAKVPIPAGTGGFAVGEGAVWAVSDRGPTLTRIDPARNAVAVSISIKLTNACPAEPPGCGEIAAGDGAVWITHVNDDTVSRVDPTTNDVTATIKVGSRPLGIAVSPGAVWVADSGGPSVSRIDPSTNRVVATIRVGPASAASDRMSVTTGAGAVWVGVSGLSAVVRIDPATNAVVSTIRLPGQPCGFVVADQKAVWAAGAHCANVVDRLDPHSNRRAGQVKGYLLAPIGLALGLGSLWLADLDAKEIVRVNPRTGRIIGRLTVGGQPIRLGIGFGSVWVRDDGGRVLRIRPQRPHHVTIRTR
jgi:YVTN family beta-propeller protein